jgi:uncharacterized YccA/Bax inhibitor family protein
MSTEVVQTEDAVVVSTEPVTSNRVVQMVVAGLLIVIVICLALIGYLSIEGDSIPQIIETTLTGALGTFSGVLISTRSR